MCIPQVLPDTPAAGGKDAVMQQIKDIDTQLAQVRADMQKLYFQKAGLNDQVTALREQKHISKLNIKQQELNTKLQAAQAKKDSAKIEELNGKITALNQGTDIAERYSGSSGTVKQCGCRYEQGYGKSD